MSTPSNYTSIYEDEVINALGAAAQIITKRAEKAGRLQERVNALEKVNAALVEQVEKLIQENQTLGALLAEKEVV